MARAFGTAGVRGVFNETQTPAQVYGLAETIAFTFGRGRYGVGWDGRKASALLSRVVASAVNAVGSDVEVFGLVPTPVIAFGARSRECAAGFAVTASHNPREFSGVKVFNGNGMELSRSEEDRIERVLAVSVQKASGAFGALNDETDVVEDYVDGIVSRYERASSPLRIAVDCGSGPGGSVTPRVLKGLGHKVFPANAQVSWRFPARQPEPTKEALADFANMLAGMDVDFGFAHDGDADRLVMVDRATGVVPDSVLSILALEGLGANGGTVVISENTSSAVAERAVELGFKVVRGRVGKTFAVLEQEHGVFATEPSKIVDPQWGIWEDGINAAALISTAISRDRSLLARTLEGLQWHYKQVNISAKVAMPELVVRAREAFRRFRVAEERTLDGYKIVFNDGSWVMFRPSGTEPKVRLYCESKSVELLETLAADGAGCVESSYSQLAS